MKDSTLSTLLRAAVVAGALAALSAGAHADVLRVPQQYFNIQVAVNNASDGDVILIKPGSYPGPVDIGTKALTLVVDSGGKASVPRLTIHDLLPGQTVVIRGLGGDGEAFAAGPSSEGVVLARNDGHVRLENAAFRGAQGSNLWDAPGQHPSGYPAAWVFDCVSVVFTHCTFTGGKGATVGDEEVQTFAGNGGAGLLATDSLISVTQSTLTGGHGGSIQDTVTYGGGDGAAGIAQTGGTLHVAGSTLRAGNGGGGDCSFWGCGSGGDGGDAIFVGGGIRLCHQELVLLPGTGGYSGDGIKAPDGKPIDKQSEGDKVTEFASRSRDLTTTAPVREGQLLGLHASAVEGDGALAWISIDPRWVLLTKYEGIFLVDNGFVLNLLVPLGTAGVTGELDVSLLVPELGPGLQGLPLHVQGVFQDTHSGVFLGSGSSTVLLDSAY